MSGTGGPGPGPAANTRATPTVPGSDSPLAGALEAIRLGWPVLPVRAGGKTPAGGHGFRDATTDPVVVQGWTATYPGCNWGVHPGPAGLLVIDVDVKHGVGGDQRWRDLEAANGGHVPTLTVRTPSGGWHFYYALPPDLDPPGNATPFGDGVDVRSGAGYVLLPGSGIDAGTYRVETNAPIAPVPDWAAEMFRQAAARPATPPPTGPLAPVGEVAQRIGALAAELRDAPLGSGNDTAASVAFMAGQYCGAGQADPESVVDRLMDAVSRWEWHGSGPDDLRKTIVRQVEAGMREPRPWVAAAPAPAWSPGMDYFDGNGAAPPAANGAGPPVVTRAPVPQGGQLTDAVLVEGTVEERLRGQFLWNRGLGWLAWDGVAWRQSDDVAVIEALREFMIGKYVAAARSGDDERAWRSTLSRARLAALADLARGMLAVPVEAMDADPWALNTPGGIVDLRTGHIRPCDPAALLTRSSRAAPSTVPSPVWERFVGEILPDADVRTYLQRVLGLALVGEVREHHLPILNGVGANGKSVLAGAIMHALGDHATEVDPDLLVAGRHVRHRTFLMRLRGLRLAFVSETDRAATFAESELKRLTGGDPIEANLMHRDPVTFAPSHSLVMVTNHLPEVSADPAVWRRLSVVPFDEVIAPERRDPGLPERLRGEAPGILRWLLLGTAAYVRHGLAAPQAVRVRTDDYRADSDHLARFLGEVCEVGPTREVGAAELYAAWQRWALVNGAKPGTNRDLPRALRGHGITQKRRAAGQSYIGVSLRPTEGGPWWPNQG